jgi:hypothetical protein
VAFCRKSALYGRWRACGSPVQSCSDGRTNSPRSRPPSTPHVHLEPSKPFPLSLPGARSGPPHQLPQHQQHWRGRREGRRLGHVGPCAGRVPPAAPVESCRALLFHHRCTTPPLLRGSSSSSSSSSSREVAGSRRERDRASNRAVLQPAFKSGERARDALRTRGASVGRDPPVDAQVETTRAPCRIQRKRFRCLLSTTKIFFSLSVFPFKFVCGLLDCVCECCVTPIASSPRFRRAQIVLRKRVPSVPTREPRAWAAWARVGQRSVDGASLCGSLKTSGFLGVYAGPTVPLRQLPRRP